MIANQNTQGFIIGAVVGGAMGVLTTMLFTTEKGKQLRKNIANKYHELEEDLKDKAENVQEAAENTGKKVAEKIKKDHS